MAKGAKELKEKPETMKPEVDRNTECSCGCGCTLSLERK